MPVSLRALFTLLLALLVWHAQASGRVHFIEHLSDPAHEHSTPVCELCVAQAQAAWGAPAAAFPVAATHGRKVRISSPTQPFSNRSRPLPYRSRAPPV